MTWANSTNGTSGANGGSGRVNGQRQNGVAPPPPARAPGESPWAAGGSTGGSGGGASTSPWAAVRKPQRERVTGRLRRVVEGLPDWEPLPPGETLVRRPGSTL